MIDLLADTALGVLAITLILLGTLLSAVLLSILVVLVRSVF